MQISRRDALMGATAAAVVTGAATIPLAIKAASVKAALGGDAHLERLHAEWRAAETRLVDATAIADETTFAARRTCGPCPLDDLGNLSGEAARAAIHSMPAWEAATKAAVARSGAAALYRRADAAGDMTSDAFARFMAAPAQTPRGVLVKLTSFIDEQEWQEKAAVETMDEVMLVAVRRDLERLAAS